MTSDTPGAGQTPTIESVVGGMPKRSSGMKLLLVCVLALFMSIPAMFIYQIIYDRSERAQDAAALVSQRYGGQQTAMGPQLLIPYMTQKTNEDGVLEDTREFALIHPETGQATGDIRSETKTSGIHEIPTYAADIRFRAEFSRDRVVQNLPADARIQWDDAYLVIGLSNPRASTGTTEITLNGNPLTPSFSLPDGSDLPRDHRFMVAPVSPLRSDLDRFDVTASVSFTGATRFSVAPFARETTIDITSDWDDPRFEGAFQQSVYQPYADGDGFSASWNIPYEGRRIPGVRTISQNHTLMWTDQVVTVRLVMAMTPYQSVERALKYAALFIGFVFLAYFLMEVVSKKKAHPAQYILVGLAQCMFFLLLLALSEQIGFDFAFLIAATMTVLMTSFYAMSVFGSRTYGLQAMGIFAMVYATIFVLMRLEDFAMLAGAFAGFLTIGATMYFTKDLDWYGITEPTEAH